MTEEGYVSDSDGRTTYACTMKSKKSGGFQSMGLNHAVLKGILRKGYKVPTPIQRKAIPLILNGKDIVAMARTGSGKTAAFLIPMLQRLKCRSAKAGARALLLSPTRELALQTLKFTKEVGKFTDLKTSLLVGGDNMEEQFAAIHQNPDVIIATPGRLLHVAVEMNLKLDSVEYVVFDEADRLFEMGFEEQLKEIIKRLPDDRQTLLFSATLPKSLVEFARAGLSDPSLVRLDVDSKISDRLKMSFLFCRFEDKAAALSYILRTVINTDREQSIVFCATKHHVEYLKEILCKLTFKCSYLYSSLDATARKINVEKFRKKQTQILLVTDLAARGVDIPLLDNVVNVHFPIKAKLFVHRVGRVARAGRSGRAFSIIAPEEMPYVLDLFLFLGRQLKLHRKNETSSDIDKDELDVVGLIPRSVLDVEQEALVQLHSGDADLDFLRKGASNAYKQYVRTRPTPSRESVERVKHENMLPDLSIHPIFDTVGKCGSTLEAQTPLLEALKNYKPKITIFEQNTSNKDPSWIAMKAKRKVHEKYKRSGNTENDDDDNTTGVDNNSNENQKKKQNPASAQEIKNVFTEIVETKFRDNKNVDQILQANKTKKAKKIAASEKDKEYFLPYRPSDFHQESGLALERPSFEKDACTAVVDFTADDTVDMHRQKNNMKWDRKRKNFVKENAFDNHGKNKKIKTESGTWIPASYKTDMYAKWLRKNKINNLRHDDSDAENNGDTNSNVFTKFKSKKKKGGSRNYAGASGKSEKSSAGGKGLRVKKFQNKNEMKSKDQILKARRIKERKQAYQQQRNNNNRRQKNSSKKTKAR